MSVLFALDASGKTEGVCVMADGRVLFEKTLDEGLTHSETLLPLVQQAFTATGLLPGDITAYAITAGPGSFTGLRIGMSLVKGLALPFATPVVPVSTLLALALGSGLRGRVVCALDARRGEVYWAAFDCDDGCRRVTEDAAGPLEDIEKSSVFTADPVFFVGDGAQMCYNQYDCRPGVKPTGSLLWPIARGAACAAAAMMENSPLPDAAGLRPHYLRQSQAERERAARQGQHATGR